MKIMDNRTLNEYKFMDTPEFVPQDKKKSANQFKQMSNWMLNHFFRTDG